MMRRLKNKLLCDKRGKSKQTSPTDPKPVNGGGGGSLPPEASPKVPPVETPSAPAPSESPERDLWQEALQELPAVVQKKLKDMGLHDLKSASMRSEIDGIVNLAKTRQEECEKRFWKVNMNGNEIVVRDYATKIVGWLQQTGDIAVQFAPPQASLPWAVIKSVMQIPVIEDEQMCALLASIEKIVRIINRGQVYELVYTPDTTPDDALKNFYKAVETLYSTTLNLLAESGTLFSAGTAKRTIDAILNPGKVPGILSDISEQENDLSREVQACESRRSALADDRLMNTLQALDAPLARVDENVSGLLEFVNETSRIETLEWISPIPYGKHHNNVKDKRTPGTGEWLLRHQKFRNWEDASSSQIFWLQGYPGTGKTVLTSSVIDHVQGVLETAPNDEGFGFFYCNRNEKDRTQLLSILQSFVRQLSTPVSNPESMQSKLWESCRQARDNASDLRFDICKQQLVESLNIYPKTTLVLDALDECDLDSRVDIIDTLNSLLSESQRPLKIFISSRPDPDIEGLLASSAQVDIQAKDNKGDVRRFLEKEIEKLAKRRALFRSLQNDIAETLLARCEGMFQWVAVQIQQIAKCSTPEAVMKRLQTLPKDLKTTYDEIYKEIEDLETSEKALADRALLWVMSAWKPLNTDELLSAIRVELKGDELQLASEIDESVLMSICKNLLVLDTQLDVWRFPHLSVAEYLQTKNHFSLQEAQGRSANICLSLLIKGYEKCDPDDESEQPAPSEKIFDITQPFQHYIRHHWVLHVQAAPNTDALLVSRLKAFLKSPNESSLQYQRWHRQCVIDGWNDRPSTSFLIPFRVENLAPANVALFAMCWFSFHAILRDWWESAEIDLTLLNEVGQSPLSIAAVVGCKPICKALVDRGYAVDSPINYVNYGSALAAAAYKGQTEIVKFLVHEAGADVNLQLENGTHGSALTAAISNGHTKTVKFLVKEAGADVNMLVPHGDYTSALGAAAYKGHLEITKFLVQDAGADVNLRQMTGREPLYAMRDEWRDSVLAIAAGRGHFEIVKFLVREAGADANLALHGEQGGSALSAATATSYNDKEMVKFLVQEGKADVNMPLEGSYGNALALAAYREKSDIVRYLVQEAGADVNMSLQNGLYGSALAACASDGPVELVKFLLDAGADVNMPLPSSSDNGGGSALAVAVLGGKIDIVRYLVEEAHADVNLQLPHRILSSVLSAAAASESDAKMEIVKYLVEQVGADVNMPLQNGFFGSVLECATYFAGARNETEIITYFLGKGADANTPQENGLFGSPLVAAASIGAIEPMKCLIEAGADVNGKFSFGKYGSALAATSFWGLKEPAELLIEAGADVNMSLENKPFANALEAVYAEMSDEDIELPKSSGAWMALLDTDKEEVEKLLREHGAEGEVPVQPRRGD